MSDRIGAKAAGDRRIRHFGEKETDGEREDGRTGCPKGSILAASSRLRTKKNRGEPGGKNKKRCPSDEDAREMTA